MSTALAEPVASSLISEGNSEELELIAERYRIAAMISEGMARASLLPVHLRAERRDGVWVPLEAEEVQANCMLICNQALRWGVDPFALAPESYVVDRKLAYQGKLVAAVINKLAGLKENLRFEFHGSGDDLEVTVIGHLKGEAEPRRVTLELARAKTDNAMWTDDPEQKLCYSGAIRWARRHKPETLLGIVEPEDTPDTVEAAPRVAEKPSGGFDLFAKYSADIDAADSETSVKRVAERVKGSGLSSKEKDALIAKAKGRWGELREPAKEPDGPAEQTSRSRWERTIRTATLAEFAGIRKGLSEDGDLSEGEFRELTELAAEYEKSLSSKNA